MSGSIMAGPKGNAKKKLNFSVQPLFLKNKNYFAAAKVLM